jgi:hypothetical protein
MIDDHDDAELRLILKRAREPELIGPEDEFDVYLAKVFGAVGRSSSKPSRGDVSRRRRVPRVASASERVQMRLSPLLLIGTASAVISTVAVVVSAVAASSPLSPPGAVGGGAPPTPAPATGLVALIISVGFFVVSWITVAVAVARDQIFQRCADAAHSHSESLIELRDWMEDTYALVGREQAAIDAKLSTLSLEYGEQRETQGYLNAMRAAAGAVTRAEVRPLRPVRPTDS